MASGGIFVKLSELGPIATAFHRILLAMPLALAWARFSASPRPRVGLWNPPRGDFLLLACSGAFLAFDLILWHISFHHTTVANSNLLANLVPFVVVPGRVDFVRRAHFGVVFGGLGDRGDRRDCVAVRKNQSVAGKLPWRFSGHRHGFFLRLVFGDGGKVAGAIQRRRHFVLGRIFVFVDSFFCGGNLGRRFLAADPFAAF